MQPNQNPCPVSATLAGPQAGYVLLIVPVVLVGILLLGTQMARRSQVAMRIAGAEIDHIQTRLCTERMNAVEVNRAVRTLEYGSAITAMQRTSTCGGVSGKAVSCTTNVLPTASALTKGCYDMTYYETLMPLSTRCRNAGGFSSLLEAKVGLGEVPLYQFAAFYNGYMYIHPGPDMVFNGRVHANDTIAFWPESKVIFTNWLTSTSAITGMRRFNGRIALALMDGSGVDDVNPVNLSGEDAYRELKLHVPDWDGFKPSHRIAYGSQPNGCGPVQTLSLKNLNGMNPHALIEWRQSGDDANLKKLKYAWRANLIYQNGGWKNNALTSVFPAVNPIAVPPGPPNWTLSAYPGRVVVNMQAENLLTHLIPVDVGKLLQRSPGDAIIYLHDELYDPLQGNRMAGGFLLYNGAALTRPLTLVSNSRIMTLGDYNTAANYTVFGGGTGVFPSALVCDHYTSLSKDYLPSEHDQPGEGLGSDVIVRNPAANLTVNSCLTVGGTRLTDGHWQGIHMLPQHIEDLETVPFTLTGSVTCLFTSKWVARIGGPAEYYAPNRNFAFDPMYNDMRNMPPGTPRLVTPVLSDWHLVRN